MVGPGRQINHLAAGSGFGEGQLYKRRDREALEHLTTATTMFNEMNMRVWQEKTEAKLRN